jgi:hypothetical protein
MRSSVNSVAFFFLRTHFEEIIFCRQSSSPLDCLFIAIYISNWLDFGVTVLGFFLGMFLRDCFKEAIG